MTLRESATPLTIGSFFLLAVTGVLMFFHLDTGLNKAAHEWLGWILLAAVVLHATVHMTSFKRYFTRPSALAVIGLFVVVLAASFISPLGKSGEPPHILAIKAVLDAPLDQVAGLARRDMPTMLEQLRAAGIAIDGKSNLRAASGDDRGEQMKALGVVFAAKP